MVLGEDHGGPPKRLGAGAGAGRSRDPAVFEHGALVSHLCLPVAHSLASLHVEPPTV